MLQHLEHIDQQGRWGRDEYNFLEVKAFRKGSKHVWNVGQVCVKVALFTAVVNNWLSSVSFFCHLNATQEGGGNAPRLC